VSGSTGTSPTRAAFRVALDAHARQALHRRGRLPLTVRILITPPHGASVVVSRALLLRP